MHNSEITAKKTQILTKFKEKFMSLNYIEKEAEALIPQNDDTVLFTNSTIIALKNFINGSQNLLKGRYIIQPCLRFQNFSFEDNFSSSIPYMSYFAQLGVLAPESDLPKVISTIASYFYEDLQIKKENLVIKSTPQFTKNNNLSDIFADNFNVLYDENIPFKYFQWSYGLADVSGEGVTFAVRNINGSYLDCGNIIEIRHKNNIVGYEFGFGLETFASRLLSKNTPMECSEISKALPQYSDPKYDLLKDMLQLSVEMLKLGIKPGKNKHKALLRKSIVILAKESIRLQISKEEMNAIIQCYVLHIDCNLDFSKMTYKYFEDRLYNLRKDSM